MLNSIILPAHAQTSLFAGLSLLVGTWDAILFTPIPPNGPDLQTPFQFTILSNGIVEFSGSPINGGTCSGRITEIEALPNNSRELRFDVLQDCFNEPFIPFYNQDTDEMRGVVQGFGGIVESFTATRA